MIDVVDYDPAWPQLFVSIRDRCERGLVGVVVVGVVHVGSTSVPGLAAKPVIDVDVIVAAEQVSNAIRALELVGFRSLGERGITDRWALEAPAELPRTNTYVVVEGSLALRNHLGIRDTLRRDPALRDEYAALKRSIVARVDDIDTYVEAKSAFLGSVLEQAGLNAEERLLIQEANRAS